MSVPPFRRTCQESTPVSSRKRGRQTRWPAQSEMYVHVHITYFYMYVRSYLFLHVCMLTSVDGISSGPPKVSCMYSYIMSFVHVCIISHAQAWTTDPLARPEWVTSMYISHISTCKYARKRGRQIPEWVVLALLYACMSTHTMFTGIVMPGLNNARVCYVWARPGFCYIPVWHVYVGRA